MTPNSVVEFIQEFWLQFVLTSLSGVLALVCRSTVKKLKKVATDREAEREAEEKEQQTMKEGIVAMLHDRLLMASNYFLKQGEITADELDNLEMMYKSYHALGGNGTITILMGRVRMLKIVPPAYLIEM